MRSLVQFLRDLALIPAMWRLAVEHARDRAVLDHIVWDILHRDSETLARVTKLPDRLRTVRSVRIAATLGLHFGDIRLRQEGGAE